MTCCRRGQSSASGANQLPIQDAKLAMAIRGKSRHYRLREFTLDTGMNWLFKQDCRAYGVA